MKLPERAFIFFVLFGQLGAYILGDHTWAGTMEAEPAMFIVAAVVWFVLRALWFLARGI